MALQITEDIKKLLGAEVLSKLEEAAKESDVFIASGKDYVPKGRFDEINTQAKDYKKQVDDYAKQVTDLTKNAGSLEDLQKKLADAEAANKTLSMDYEGKIAKREKDYLINDGLRGYNTKDAKTILPLLDFEKIIVKDGVLSGLKEQIEPLQKTHGYLFGDIQQQPKVDRLGHVIKPAIGDDENVTAEEIAGRYVDPEKIKHLTK